MIVKPLYSRITTLAVVLSMMMNTPQSVDSFAFSSSYSPKNSLFAKPTNKLSAAKKKKTAMEFHSPSMMLSGMMVDPMLEAEVLTDISHLGLDLATLLQPGRSSLLPIRIAAFVGRLLAISADYIPDHMVLPEEALFQLFMLGVTGWGIAQAALLPLFAHMANNVTIQDGKAYSRLFAPAGISWSDFKACRTLAMDWMTLDQHEEIRVTDHHDADEDDDYMYWLYSGELQVVASTTSNEKNATLYKMSSPPQQLGNKNEAHGLLGELQLLASNMRYADDKKTAVTKQRGSTGSTTTTTGATTSSPPTVVVARATVPATKVLRIHTPSLKRLMDSDKQFASAVHNLMLQGMQSKLQAQLLLSSSTSVNATA